jgi:cytochrome c peroxidase
MSTERLLGFAENEENVDDFPTTREVVFTATRTGTGVVGELRKVVEDVTSLDTPAQLRKSGIDRFDQLLSQENAREIINHRYEGDETLFHVLCRRLDFIEFGDNPSQVFIRSKSSNYTCTR